MKEVVVSGNIYAEQDSRARDGEVYIIRNCFGQGWQIPTIDIEPADLRALADRIERFRAGAMQKARGGAQ